MRILSMLLPFIFCLSAFAYKDGTYHCKNEDGTPDNIYKVKTVVLPGLGEGVPYIEISRFSKIESGNTMTAILETKLRGFPAQITMPNGDEVLQLAAISLEFANQRLLNCKP